MHRRTSSAVFQSLSTLVAAAYRGMMKSEVRYGYKPAVCLMSGLGRGNRRRALMLPGARDGISGELPGLVVSPAGAAGKTTVLTVKYLFERPLGQYSLQPRG